MLLEPVKAVNGTTYHMTLKQVEIPKRSKWEAKLHTITDVDVFLSITEDRVFQHVPF